MLIAYYELTIAPVLVAERLAELTNVREVARELLAISKQRMAARSSKPAPTFVVGDFFSFPLKGYIFIYKSANT